jgi:hypothetical protein
MQAQMQAQMMQQQAFGGQQPYGGMQDVNTNMSSALQGLIGNFLAQNNPGVSTNIKTDLSIIFNSVLQNKPINFITSTVIKFFVW